MFEFHGLPHVLGQWSQIQIDTGSEINKKKLIFQTINCEKG